MSLRDAERELVTLLREVTTHWLRAESALGTHPSVVEEYERRIAAALEKALAEAGSEGGEITALREQVTRLEQALQEIADSIPERYPSPTDAYVEMLRVAHAALTPPPQEPQA